MKTWYVFESRETDKSHQYRITVVHAETPVGVLEVMVDHDGQFRVVTIVESLDEIMEVVQRYMDMEAKA